MGVFVPSGKLTWDERLDVRKVALNAAVHFYEGRGGPSPGMPWGSTSDDIIFVARKFEKYLTGEDE